MGSRLTNALIQSLPNEGSEDELWRRLLGKIAVKLKREGRFDLATNVEPSVCVAVGLRIEPAPGPCRYRS